MRRILSLTLALLAAFILLTGCGGPKAGVFTLADVESHLSIHSFDVGIGPIPDAKTARDAAIALFNMHSFGSGSYSNLTVYYDEAEAFWLVTGMAGSTQVYMLAHRSGSPIAVWADVP